MVAVRWKESAVRSVWGIEMTPDSRNEPSPADPLLLTLRLSLRSSLLPEF